MHRLTLKKVPPIEQERLREIFLKLFPAAQRRTEQSCKYTLRNENPFTVLKQYTNGTLYIETAIESVLGQFQDSLHAHTSPVNSPPTDKHFIRKEAATWIGTDECGKGDYFGPMVVAGMWLDAETSKRLAASGVRDSKELSDTQIVKLATEIRASCPGQFAIIICSAEEYNNILPTPPFNNNSARILGSMHAQAISSLLVKHDCDDIVIDKFGLEKHVLDFLEASAKEKNILFRQRAESNIAVAAASILAREKFLQAMDELSERVGVELPKGASSEVERVAAMIVARRGESILHAIAKVHFKTTLRVVRDAKHF